MARTAKKANGARLDVVVDGQKVTALKSNITAAFLAKTPKQRADGKGYTTVSCATCKETRVIHSQDAKQVTLCTEHQRLALRAKKREHVKMTLICKRLIERLRVAVPKVKTTKGASYRDTMLKMAGIATGVKTDDLTKAIEYSRELLRDIKAKASKATKKTKKVTTTKTKKTRTLRAPIASSVV